MRENYLSKGGGRRRTIGASAGSSKVGDRPCRRSPSPRGAAPAQVAEQLSVGAVFVPLKLAWKPKVVLPPADKAPL